MKIGCRVGGGGGEGGRGGGGNRCRCLQMNAGVERVSFLSVEVKG
jgi:hypothetical protein